MVLCCWPFLLSLPAAADRAGGNAVVVEHKKPGEDPRQPLAHTTDTVPMRWAASLRAS